jgi:FtsP/CotA-like multicopper oxidase with cupredoxin domain
MVVLVGGALVLVGVVLAARSLAATGPRLSYAACGSISTEPKIRIEWPTVDVSKWGLRPFRNPPELSSHGRVLRTDLDVRFTDPKETSIAGCPVRLRSYNGQLVGPTLRARPGDTLRITLHNRLPVETMAQRMADIRQETSQANVTMTPNPFNVTNLHTHGLHVSPAGHSDNVLHVIQPRTTWQYVVRIPRNHPEGTFWYHAHAHGSTAVQVASGMEGALIVEDDPQRIPPELAAASTPEREKIFVLQVISYEPTVAGPGEVAARDNPTSFTDLFPQDPKKKPPAGPAWPETVNGQLVPVITIQPGEVQRWRFIDATFRASIHLAVKGSSGNLPLHEIALDGLYTGRVDTWGTNASGPRYIDLEPGYRSDVLFQAPQTPGTYDLVDLASPATVSLHGIPEPGEVFAKVVVQGTPLQMRLPTAGEMAPLAYRPLQSRGKVVLANNLEQRWSGVQRVAFGIDGVPPKRNPRNYFTVNSAPFQMSAVRYVKLHAIDKWVLSSDPSVEVVAPHVFHIHVNPFLWRRPSPNGRPEWVWKDTLLIPAGQAVTVYSQYLDYTGSFVLHCHILDHEDLGMMQVVDVVRRLPLPSAHH